MFGEIFRDEQILSDMRRCTAQKQSFIKREVGFHLTWIPCILINSVVIDFYFPVVFFYLLQMRSYYTEACVQIDSWPLRRRDGQEEEILQRIRWLDQ